MKHYTSFETIESDLKKLNLERQIAWEELKLSKNEVLDDLQPLGWIKSIGKFMAKYGVFLLFKRFISK